MRREPGVGDVELGEAAVHLVGEVVEVRGDVEACALVQTGGGLASRRLACGHRGGEGLLDLIELGLDPAPVVGAVAAGALSALAPRVGLAPALLGLGLPLGGVAVAEELEALLGREFDVHVARFQEEQDVVAGGGQLCDAVGDECELLAEHLRLVARAVEQRGDSVERQPERSVGEDLTEPRRIRRRVGAPAAGAARRRLEQTDLVVVVQRAHRGPSEAGELADGEVGRGIRHGPTVRPLAA